MFSIEPSTVGTIVVRVFVVYIALLMMLRLAGRRTLSDITPLDMLVMLLISETVSPAMTAGEESVTGGLVAAGTLVLASVGASALAFRQRRVENLMSGSPARLIRDGKLDEVILRRYRITNEDLQTALHENGVLSVSEVRRAFVEPDGQITVIKQK